MGLIFGALVLGVGSCTVWFVSTVKAPVDKSNEFLAAIGSGDYAGAVALSDPGCNQGMSTPGLTAAFQGADITYNLNDSSITDSNATISGSFAMVGQNVSTIQIFLLNNDGWKVCGFNAK